MSISDSSKRIVQIIQLLEERNMSFSFCLNKLDNLALCGLTLLYQVVDFKQDSKLTRDIGRLVNASIKTLNKTKAPGCVDLARVATLLITLDESLRVSPSSGSPRDESMPAPPNQRHPSSHKSPKKKAEMLRQEDKVRRMTMPSAHVSNQEFYPRSRQSFDSDIIPSRQSHILTPASRIMPNLDYLSLDNTPSQTQPSSPAGLTRMQTPSSMQSMMGGDVGQKSSGLSNSEWEALLGTMDGGMHNVYDAIYGGPSLPPTTNTNSWSPDSWDLTSFNIEELGRGNAAPQSVLSLSDESLSSGEEVAPSELGLSVGSAEYNKHLQVADGFGFDLEGFPL